MHILSIFLLVIGVILLSVYIYDKNQKSHSLLRNFPLVGRTRWIAEWLRPKIVQYFVESDINGKPISREIRSLVYQRSKNETDKIPFGTKHDLYKPGAEWFGHIHKAIVPATVDRIKIGSNLCSQPYDSSLINSSAMSYGALGKNAILAIGKGAKLAGFAQNTGEGGLSEYHLENGNDIIFQMGTGYFGCRNFAGYFDRDKFKVIANNPQVKMIEIKMSQGAKPGHSGILPAAKNTEEIAKIRGVEPHTEVLSPQTHSAFKTNNELLTFINDLRQLSNGKPIGIKMCIGNPNEFRELTQTMQNMQMYPDFITIDGGEGGTGAAPLEFTNNIGFPLIDALAFVDNDLKLKGLRSNIKIVASGRIFTGFDIVKALCVGADLVNSARGMMLSLGCIMALECHLNTCPSGIATTDPRFMNGLDVENKSKRIYNFHKNTIHSVKEILQAIGVSKTRYLNRSLLYKRMYDNSIKSYDILYPDNFKL